MDARVPPPPRPDPGHDRPRPAKPDPRPMRAALGLGGIAALSAIAAGIVSPPRPDAVLLAAPPQQLGAVDGQGAADSPTGSAPDQPAAPATPQIRYIQLQPGQTAPPGAIVLPASPQATVAIQLNPGGVTARPAPAATARPAPKPTPIIIKTTQSGRVVP